MATFRALCVQQGESRLFVTSMKAGKLTDDFCRPDVWSPNNKDGYQRELSVNRFKGIADYMEGREGMAPLMPQAIVLNCRAEVRFAADKDGTGVLEIPDKALPLYEVDGQHRIGGARRAVQERPELSEYELPVVITENLNRLSEAVLFYVINTRQKKVPTDLAQRIITNELKEPVLRHKLIELGQDWVGQATKVVDILNGTPGQPWQQAIGIPGIKLKYILKQNSFVQSLKPILRAPAWEDQEPEDVARALVHYWKALRDVFPDAFADPRDYVIQKTIGVFPLHEIAPMVFERAVERAGYPIKPEAIRAVLNELAARLRDDYCPTSSASQFWHRSDGEAGKYTGQKGFRTLKLMLRERLPELKKQRVA